MLERWLSRHFHEHAAKEVERRGMDGPRWEGQVPGLDDADVGSFSVGAAGLAFDLHGHGVDGTRMERRQGRLRQALVPDRWDGSSVVVLIAGAGLYVGCYPAFIGHLLLGSAHRPPVAVVFEDIIGYGFSTQGHSFADAPSFAPTVEAQGALVADAGRLAGATAPRIAIIGHSLGGQIALELALQAPQGLAGVIALSPLVRLPGFLGTWVFRWLLRWLANNPRLATRYLYRSKIRGAGKVRLAEAFYEEEFLRRRRADPFADDSIVPRSLLPVVEAGERLLKARPASRSSGPCIRLIHSNEDQTCAHKGTEELARRWEQAGADVAFQTLGAYPHQLLNLRAPWRREVFEAIDACLEEILGTSPSG